MSPQSFKCLDNDDNDNDNNNNNDNNPFNYLNCEYSMNVNDGLEI